MSIPAGFVRARKALPCPVCARPDWCLVADPNGPEDGAWCQRPENATAAWIRRGERTKAGQRFVPAQGNVRSEPLPAWSAARRAELARAKEEANRAELAARMAIDFPSLARTFAAALTSVLADQLADELGLSVGVLRELGAGYAARHPMRLRPTDEHPDGRVVAVTAWSFPMRDGAGEIIGIRFRSPDGFKFSHSYSANGLFIPDGIRPIMGTAGTLFSPEGPTSTAALRCLGLRAVGRPNNQLGAAYLAAYCRRLRPCRVVLVGDNDAKPDGRWPGLDGAISTAAELQAGGVTCAVSVMLPPDGIKDVRDWRQLGGGRGDVLERARVQRRFKPEVLRYGVEGRATA